MDVTRISPPPSYAHLTPNEECAYYLLHDWLSNDELIACMARARGREIKSPPPVIRSILKAKLAHHGYTFETRKDEGRARQWKLHKIPQEKAA